jgi:hypothetical protein
MEGREKKGKELALPKFRSALPGLQAQMQSHNKFSLSICRSELHHLIKESIRKHLACLGHLREEMVI